MTRTAKTSLIVLLVPCLLLVALSLTVSLAHRNALFDDPAKVPAADAAVVPGAGILRSGEPSPVLRDRALAAVELYKAGKVKKIIASGNSVEEHDEVEPLRAFLVREGVPEDAILLDYAGLDTYSTLYRARELFGAESLIIVSQSFHLPRAVYIARRLGIEAYGLSADDGHYKLSNYFREMFADAKAVLNILAARTPEHLSREVPE